MNFIKIFKFLLTLNTIMLSLSYSFCNEPIVKIKDDYRNMLNTFSLSIIRLYDFDLEFTSKRFIDIGCIGMVNDTCIRYKINYEEFVSERKKLNDVLKVFYNSEIDLIENLTLFSKDISFCSWIKGWSSIYDIYSSHIYKEYDYLTQKKISALILIINYIVNNEDKIIVYQIPESEADEMYKEITKFYNKNKSLNVKEFRNKFKNELSNYFNFPILE